MTVLVRLPAALAEHADGSRALHVDVSADATLGDVIAALGRMHPALQRRIVDETGQLRRFVNVYIGNDECRALGGLAASVPPDTELFVIGSIAGGAQVHHDTTTRAEPCHDFRLTRRTFGEIVRANRKALRTLPVDTRSGSPLVTTVTLAPRGIRPRSPELRRQ